MEIIFFWSINIVKIAWVFEPGPASLKSENKREMKMTEEKKRDQNHKKVTFSFQAFFLSLCFPNIHFNHDLKII